jgi:outer membrane protein assembly factor BamB
MYLESKSEKPWSSVVWAGTVSLSLACFVAAEDWPQWRGPNRDDRSAESGLLREWPAGGPPLAWKATGLGSGFSGVSIADNRVVTAGDRGPENFVIALDLAGGKQLWSTKLGKSGAPGWGGFAGPRCSPTIDGERVYALGQYGEFVCLETATGKEVWRKNFVADLGGAVPEWGYSESPLVDGNNMMVTPGGGQGAIVALNKLTGAVVWRSKEFTDAAQYSSIIAVDHGGVRQYIQLTQASVVGVAAHDGRVLWRAPRKGEVAVVPTPVFHDGLVYVSSGYKVGCNVFKVSAAGGKFASEQIYANKVMANHHGGVVLVGDHLYGYSDDKGWVCQELKSGAEVWAEKSKLGKGSLTYADGHLYLREEKKGNSRIALIEATPAGYKEKGVFSQPNRSDKESWPHPVISGGKLFIRDQDVLLCFNVKP